MGQVKTQLGCWCRLCQGAGVDFVEEIMDCWLCMASSGANQILTKKRKMLMEDFSVVV